MLERITFIGRRSILESAFTAKELREFLHLPQVCIDAGAILEYPPQENKHLQRIWNIWKEATQINYPSKAIQVSFLFETSPIQIHIKDNKVVQYLETSNRKLECEVIISSIGYCLKNDIFALPIRNGRIENQFGKVKNKIYVSGWCKTGPHGVLASTLLNAYETADSIIRDWLDPKQQENQ